MGKLTETQRLLNAEGCRLALPEYNPARTHKLNAQGTYDRRLWLRLIPKAVLRWWAFRAR